MKFHILTLTVLAGITVAQVRSKKKVICYYVSIDEKTNEDYRLAPDDIDLSLCTHIGYVFFMPDIKEGLLPRKYIPGLRAGMKRFLVLRRERPELEFIFSIGGWDEGTKTFSKIASDPDKRAWFYLYLTLAMRKWDAEGCDLNWQWPALREGSSAADKDNYAKFIMGMKEYFKMEARESGKRELKLYVTVPSEIQFVQRGFDLEVLKKYADFLVIYSMDYHLPTEPSINHPAPLYVDPKAEPLNSGLDVDTTVRFYLDQGVPPEKLLLGIPTYGRSFTLDRMTENTPGSPAQDEGVAGFATNNPGTLAYYEICTNIKREDWTVRHPNDSAVGPYAFKGSMWVGYDDENIVRKKAEYARKRGLGGLSFWTLDMDDFRGMCQPDKYPLVKAGKEVLLIGGDEPRVEEEYVTSKELDKEAQEQQDSSLGQILRAGSTRTNSRASDPKPSKPQGSNPPLEPSPSPEQLPQQPKQPFLPPRPPAQPNQLSVRFQESTHTSDETALAEEQPSESLSQSQPPAASQGVQFISSSRDILINKIRLYINNNHYDNVDYRILWG